MTKDTQQDQASEIKSTTAEGPDDIWQMRRKAEARVVGD